MDLDDLLSPMMRAGRTFWPSQFSLDASVSEQEKQTMMCEIQGLMILLRRWKQMPDAPPSELSLFSVHRERHHPFTATEIIQMRRELERISPASYRLVFPEERP